MMPNTSIVAPHHRFTFVAGAMVDVVGDPATAP
jgi:hypothetical protein